MTWNAPTFPRRKLTCEIREQQQNTLYFRMTEFLADAGERITILKVVCRRVINRYSSEHRLHGWQDCWDQLFLEYLLQFHSLLL
jgi:hypothetical protein